MAGNENQVSKLVANKNKLTIRAKRLRLMIKRIMQEETNARMQLVKVEANLALRPHDSQQVELKRSLQNKLIEQVEHFLY